MAYVILTPSSNNGQSPPSSTVTIVHDMRVVEESGAEFTTTVSIDVARTLPPSRINQALVDEAISYAANFTSEEVVEVFYYSIDKG